MKQLKGETLCFRLGIHAVHRIMQRTWEQCHVLLLWHLLTIDRLLVVL